jgi:hypothetical protein
MDKGFPSSDRTHLQQFSEKQIKGWDFVFLTEADFSPGR